MACCCNQIKFLGCAECCGVLIETGIIAPFTATYTAIISTPAGAFIMDVEIATGDPISFTIDELRCDSIYTIQIINSDGDQMSDADGNDCFRLQTNFVWNPQAITEETFGLPLSMCLDAISVILVPPEAGGNFSGDGVIWFDPDYYFDPATAGAGVHVIVYTHGTTVVQTTITVYNLPTVTLDALTVEDTDPAFTLSNGSPAGGSYYINDSETPSTTFDPGEYESNPTLLYIYINPTSGCGSFASITVTINK